MSVEREKGIGKFCNYCRVGYFHSNNNNNNNNNNTDNYTKKKLINIMQ